MVPAAAQASLAQVQAKVMPAAQAVQAVSKAYVDQAIAQASQSSGLTATGGTLTGPLYLSSDPTQPLQAADKHYVDTQVATAVPLAGGNMTGALTTPAMNGVQADVRGERYIHERERRESDGSAHDGRATGGAQREGVWRGMRRRDRRYERPAGGAELRERARRGADDSARDVQDADT